MPDPQAATLEAGTPVTSTSLVGQHGVVLAELVRQYRLVQDSGQSRAVVLHGPSGRGKTRLVQELAIHLAEPGDPGLAAVVRDAFCIGANPRDVDQHRKTVELPEAVRARLPFLWGAVRCDQSADRRPVPAYARLYESLRSQTALGQKQRKVLANLGVAALGQFATIPGVIGDFIELGAQVAPLGLVGKDVADRSTGERLSLNELEDQFSTTLAIANHKEQPGVIVIDDAHFADSTTVHLVSALFLSRPAVQRAMLGLKRWSQLQPGSTGPLLVIMTTWDEKVNEAPLSTLATALHADLVAGPAQLDRPAATDLAEALALAAGLDTDTAKMVAERIRPRVKRGGTTPYRVARAVADLAVDFAVGGLDALTSGAGVEIHSLALGEDVEDVWSQLSDPVRRNLAVLRRISSPVAPEVARVIFDADDADGGNTAAFVRFNVLRDDAGLTYIDPAYDQLVDAFAVDREVWLDSAAHAALVDALDLIVSADASAMNDDAFDTRIYATLAQLRRFEVPDEPYRSADVWAWMAGTSLQKLGDHPERTAVLRSLPVTDSVAAWAAAWLPASYQRRLRVQALADEGLRQAASRPLAPMALTVALRLDGSDERDRTTQLGILRHHVGTSVEAAEILLRCGSPADRELALVDLCDVHCRREPDRLGRLLSMVTESERSRVLSVAEDVAKLSPRAAKFLLSSTGEATRATGVDLLVAILEEESDDSLDSTPSARALDAARTLLAGATAVEPARRSMVVELVGTLAQADPTVAEHFALLPWPEAWPTALDVMRSCGRTMPSVLRRFHPPVTYRTAALAVMAQYAGKDAGLARELTFLATPGSAERALAVEAINQLSVHDDDAALTALRLPECAARWPELEARLLDAAAGDAQLARRLAKERQFRDDDRLDSALRGHATANLGVLALLAARTENPDDLPALRAILNSRGSIRAWSHELKSEDVGGVCRLLAPEAIDTLVKTCRSRAGASSVDGRLGALAFAALSRHERPELRESAVELLVAHLGASPDILECMIAAELVRLAVRRADLRRGADALLERIADRPIAFATDALARYCRPVLTASEQESVLATLDSLASESAECAITLLELAALNSSSDHRLAAWRRSALSIADADPAVAGRLAALQPAEAPGLLLRHARTDDAAMAMLAQWAPLTAIDAASDDAARAAAVGVAAAMLSNGDLRDQLVARWPGSPEAQGVNIAELVKNHAALPDELLSSVSQASARPIARLLGFALTETELGRLLKRVAACPGSALGGAFVAESFDSPQMMRAVAGSLWAPLVPGSKAVGSAAQRRSMLLACAALAASDVGLWRVVVARAGADGERRLVRSIMLERLVELPDEALPALRHLTDESVAPADLTRLSRRLVTSPAVYVPMAFGGDEQQMSPDEAISLARSASDPGFALRAASHLRPWIGRSTVAAIAAVDVARDWPEAGPGIQRLGEIAQDALRSGAGRDVAAAVALWSIDEREAFEALIGLGASGDPAVGCALLARWAQFTAAQRKKALPLVLRIGLRDLDTAARAVVTPQLDVLDVQRLVEAHAARWFELASVLADLQPSRRQQALLRRILPAAGAALSELIAARVEGDAWASVSAALELSVPLRVDKVREIFADLDLAAQISARAWDDLDALELLASVPPLHAQQKETAKLLRWLASKGTVEQVSIIARHGSPELRDVALKSLHRRVEQRPRQRRTRTGAHSDARRALLQLEWSDVLAQEFSVADRRDAVALLNAAAVAGHEQSCARVELSPYLPQLVLAGQVPQQRRAAALTALLERDAATETVVGALCLADHSLRHKDRRMLEKRVLATPPDDLVDALAASRAALLGFAELGRDHSLVRGTALCLAAVTRSSTVSGAVIAELFLRRDDARASALLPQLRLGARTDSLAAAGLASRAVTSGDAALAAACLRRSLDGEPQLALSWAVAAERALPQRWTRVQPHLLPPRAMRVLLAAALRDDDVLARVALLSRAGAIQYSNAEGSALREQIRTSTVGHADCLRERLAWGLADSDDLDRAVARAATDVSFARLAARTLIRRSGTASHLAATVSVLTVEASIQDMWLLSGMVKRCIEVGVTLPEETWTLLRDWSQRDGKAVLTLALLATRDDELLDLADLVADLPPTERRVVVGALADDAELDRLAAMLAPVGSPQHLALRQVLLARGDRGDATAAARGARLALVGRGSGNLARARRVLTQFRGDGACARLVLEIDHARGARRVEGGPQAMGDVPTRQAVESTLQAALSVLGTDGELASIGESTVARLAGRAPHIVAIAALGAHLPTVHYRRIARLIPADSQTFKLLRNWDGSTRAAILFAWLAIEHRPALLPEARALLRDVLDGVPAGYAAGALAALASSEIQQLEAQARIDELAHMRSSTAALAEIRSLVADNPTGGRSVEAAIAASRLARTQWWLRGEARSALLPYVELDARAAVALAYLAADDGERSEAEKHLRPLAASPDVAVAAALSIVSPGTIDSAQRALIEARIVAGPGDAVDEWVDCVRAALLSDVSADVVDSVLGDLERDWTLAPELAVRVPDCGSRLMAVAVDRAPAGVLRVVVQELVPAARIAPVQSLRVLRESVVALATDCGDRTGSWTQALATLDEEPSFAPWLAHLASSAPERRALTVVLDTLLDRLPLADRPALVTAKAVLADGPAADRIAREAIAWCGRKLPTSMAQHLVDELSSERLADLLGDAHEGLLDALCDLAETDAHRAAIVAEALATVDPRRAAIARRALLEVSGSNVRAAHVAVDLIAKHGDQAEHRAARSILERAGLGVAALAPLIERVDRAPARATANDGASPGRIGATLGRAETAPERLHALADFYDLASASDRDEALEALLDSTN